MVLEAEGTPRAEKLSWRAKDVLVAQQVVLFLWVQALLVTGQCGRD